MAAKKSLKHTAHHPDTNKKPATPNWPLLGGIALAILAFIYVTTSYNVSNNSMTKPTPIPDSSPTAGPQTLAEEEKKQIDQWIVDNNLNDYGDFLDTVYAGGTPLFDEKTGTYQDKYDYILRNHPERPWKQ